MKILLFSMLLCFLATSCSSGDSAENIAAEITKIETEIGNDPGHTQAKITPLLAKYEEYAALQDADTKMKVNYLLRAGEMASLIKEYDKALGYYEKILTEYPDSPKAATAMFMKGYTLDDKMDKLDEAKSVYEDFLKKYPKNDFADDAEFLLKNLGKTEEEIIQQFGQK